jgi:hypothetical protein
VIIYLSIYMIINGIAYTWLYMPHGFVVSVALFSLHLVVRVAVKSGISCGISWAQLRKTLQNSSLLAKPHKVGGVKTSRHSCQTSP